MTFFHIYKPYLSLALLPIWQKALAAHVQELVETELRLKHGLMVGIPADFL